MLKSKSRKSTVTDTDYETQILQVNKVNAKVHDLNIESMREVDRLQSLIEEYKKITKMMYYLLEFKNRQKNCDNKSVYNAEHTVSDKDNNSFCTAPANKLTRKLHEVMKKKIKTFCLAMEKGEKE